jgi:hypothetical protein
MAADLHLHVLGPGSYYDFETNETIGTFCTKEDVALFHSSTLGTPFFNPGLRDADFYDGPVYRAVRGSPNIWIGEVSWLKAMVLDEPDTFIPSMVMAMAELIGWDFKPIDDKFIEAVKLAFDNSNETGYSLTGLDTVLEFCYAHRGKQTFQVSW